MTRTLVRKLGGGLLAAALVACGGGDGGGAPYIDALMPAMGAVGSDVEILGGRFCGPEATDVNEDDSCVAPPDGFVSFGAEGDVLRAQVKAWKGTRITVGVPANAPAGASTVVVTVGGVPSNAATFSVTE